MGAAVKIIAVLALVALLAGCGGSEEPLPEQGIGRPECGKTEACK
jgi:hypothetical protein